MDRWVIGTAWAAGLTLGFRCPGADPRPATVLPGSGGAGGVVATTSTGDGGVGGDGGSGENGGFGGASSSSGSPRSTTSGSTITPCEEACVGLPCGACVDFCLDNVSACSDLTVTDAVECLDANQCEDIVASACIDQRCTIFDTCDVICGTLGTTWSQGMCNAWFNDVDCRADCLDAIGGCTTMGELDELESCSDIASCGGPAVVCGVTCLSGPGDVTTWGL